MAEGSDNSKGTNNPTGAGNERRTGNVSGTSSETSAGHVSGTGSETSAGHMSGTGNVTGRSNETGTAISVTDAVSSTTAQSTIRVEPSKMVKGTMTELVEDALKEIGCGWYQFYKMPFILLTIFMNAMYNSNYVFVAADVPYRCKVPECESDPPKYEAGDWRDFALPPGDEGRCYRYTHADDSDSCTADHFTKETVQCEDWIYGEHNTLVPEFDLACQDWKRTMVGTVLSLGKFTALIYTGLISDRFGRLPVFVGSGVSPAVMGLIRSFSTSYYMYLILQFIDTALSAGVYPTGYVFVMEMVTANRRVMLGSTVPIVFSMGQATLAYAAWAVPYWRWLIRVIYAPSFICIFYFCILDESPRWLATQGYFKKAVAVLNRTAKYNHVNFSPKIQQCLLVLPKSKVKKKLTTAERVVKKKSLCSQVSHSKVLLCRMIICSLWWIICTLVYYGLSINSVSLAGNRYVNFLLSSLAELPGYVMNICALDRFGRRYSIGLAFLLCGASLVIVPLVPNDLHGVLLFLTLFGKTWISMVFAGIYIYTAELFPTQIRHSMLSMSSMIGRTGQILAPQTPLLRLLWKPLPYLIFGVLAVVAAFMMVLVPETKLQILTDTVAQEEQRQKDSKSKEYIGIKKL